MALGAINWKGNQNDFLTVTLFAVCAGWTCIIIQIHQWQMIIGFAKNFRRIEATTQSYMLTEDGSDAS